MIWTITLWLALQGNHAEKPFCYYGQSCQTHPLTKSEQRAAAQRLIWETPPEPNAALLLPPKEECHKEPALDGCNTLTICRDAHGNELITSSALSRCTSPTIIRPPPYVTKQTETKQSEISHCEPKGDTLYCYGFIMGEPDMPLTIERPEEWQCKATPADHVFEIKTKRESEIGTKNTVTPCVERYCRSRGDCNHNAAGDDEKAFYVRWRQDQLRGRIEFAGIGQGEQFKRMPTCGVRVTRELWMDGKKLGIIKGDLQ